MKNPVSLKELTSPVRQTSDLSAPDANSKDLFGVGEVKKVEDDDNGVLITQNIVAKGNEAKYVLEYGPTRSLILDDLTELGMLLNFILNSVENDIFRIFSGKC